MYQYAKYKVKKKLITIYVVREWLHGAVIDMYDAEYQNEVGAYVIFDGGRKTSHTVIEKGSGVFEIKDEAVKYYTEALRKKINEYYDLIESVATLIENPKFEKRDY